MYRNEAQTTNWRAESTFTASSKLDDNEKAFLKAAKKIREILKLEKSVEGGAKLEATQKAKLDSKGETIAELTTLARKLPAGTELFEKNADVVALLPAHVVPKPASKPVAPPAVGGKGYPGAPAPGGASPANKAPPPSSAPRQVKPRVAEERHARPVTSLAVSADGERVYTSSKDKCVLQWNHADVTKAERHYWGHDGAVYGVDADREGFGLLCSVAADGKALFWRERREPGISEATSTTTVGGLAKGVNWAPAGDGALRVAIFTDKFGSTPPSLLVLEVDIKDLSTKELQRITPKTAKPPPTVAIFWTKAGDSLVTAHADGWIRTWADGKPALSVQGPKSLVWATRSGDFILATSLEGTGYIYNAATLEPVRHFTPRPVRPLRCAALSHGFEEDDKSWLVVAGGIDPKDVTTTKPQEGEFNVELCSPLGEQWHSFQAHFGPVQTLAALPNGAFVSGGEDGCVNKYWSNQ